MWAMSRFVPNPLDRSFLLHATDPIEEADRSRRDRSPRTSTKHGSCAETSVTICLSTIRLPLAVAVLRPRLGRYIPRPEEEAKRVFG